MKREIKKFEYEGNEITFLSGENVMVNANEMANYFDVKPNFWLKTDNAQRIIAKYSVLKNINTADLVIVKQGGDPNKQGTWLHEDIALVFAQWLSPEFYFWCNDRIKELLKYGITAAEEKTREIVFKLSEATGKLKENSSCRIGKYKIYETLRIKGILNEHNKPHHEYIDKGYFKMMPYNKNSMSRYVVTTEDGLKWLNQLLYPEQLDVVGDRLVKLENYIFLALEGIDAIGETILYNKGGVKTEEQNRLVTTNLRIVMEKIKKCTQGVAVIKN
jgi:hypothetical protein